MLPDLIRRGREPTVGITVSQATITLRVTARGRSHDACRQINQPTIDTIRECLGELVFGEEDDELQHAVARMLAERRETLAIAEWGTGGLIADWLSALPEAASVFRGGKIVTSLDSASHLLGIDRLFEPHEHAKAMAAAVREQGNADYGISLGAFPSSPMESDAKVFIGLATRDEAQVAGRRFAGHPSILKERAAKQALDLLRLHLMRS